MCYVIIVWELKEYFAEHFVKTHYRQFPAAGMITDMTDRPGMHRINNIINNKKEKDLYKKYRLKGHMLRKYRLVVCVMLLFSLCAALLCSCRAGGSGEKKISIHVIEHTTKDNTLIQIPEFVTSNEEIRRNIRELDRKVNYLKRLVEREEKKGSHMEMLSYVNLVKGYPQVTVVWYVSEENTRDYNLMTLGADEKNSAPVTSREALVMTGMTGVDLSLKVGRLAQEAGIRGVLQSTEMQGFIINEKGNVSEIFMKLTSRVENGETETEEEHFFSYVLEEDKLVSLFERGFDVP